MEFNANNVYTYLNADKLKIGSKVFVSDSLKLLKEGVNSERIVLGKLTNIFSDEYASRFGIDKSTSSWAFAYLVEEPNLLKWTDINVGDVLVRDGMECLVLARDTNKYIDNNLRILLAHDGWISDSELSEYIKKES